MESDLSPRLFELNMIIIIIIIIISITNWIFRWFRSEKLKILLE